MFSESHHQFCTVGNIWFAFIPPKSYNDTAFSCLPVCLDPYCKCVLFISYCICHLKSIKVNCAKIKRSLGNKEREQCLSIICQQFFIVKMETPFFLVCLFSGKIFFRWVCEYPKNEHGDFQRLFLYYFPCMYGRDVLHVFLLEIIMHNCEFYRG